MNTIKGWLKNRAEYMFSGGKQNTYESGHLMPVIGREWQRRIPEGLGRLHYFSVQAARFASVIDQDNVNERGQAV